MKWTATLLSLGVTIGGCGARSPLEGEGPGTPGSPFDASVVTDGARPGDLAAGRDGAAAPDGFLPPAPCVPMPARPLSLPARSPAAPALAFDGRRYGVLWVEMLDGGGCGRGEWSFATLDKSGVVSGGTVSLGTAGDSGATGTLHVIDGEFWAILGGSDGIRAFPLSDPSPEPIVLSGERTFSHDAAVMADGRLAVATAFAGPGRRVTLRVFDGVGPELWRTDLAEPADWVSVAETEVGLAIALSQGFERVLATRVSAGEPPRAATVVYENVSGGSFISGFADLTRVEGGSAVFFARSGERPRPIEMARVRPDGSVRDLRPVGAPSNSIWPTAARDPGTGDIGLLWKHSSPDASSYTLRFRSFDARGESTDEERDVFPDHSWIGCGDLDRMALVSSVTGWGFATAQVTTDGRRTQIIFGEVCR